MNDKTKIFGGKPYSRMSLGSVAGEYKRKYADSCTTSPAELREHSRLHNPEGRCIYCGAYSVFGSVTNPNDHILAVSRGGLTVAGCMTVACGGCNIAKGELHPVAYWTKLKTEGRKLFIESEEEFRAFLEAYTAPFRESYPLFYSVASTEGPLTPEQELALGVVWSSWYKENVTGLEDPSLWFVPPKSTATADKLRDLLPVIWPNYDSLAKKTKADYLYALGLMVTDFGEEATRDIISGAGSATEYSEYMETQVKLIKKAHGPKHKRATLLTTLSNAVLANCYGVDVKPVGNTPVSAALVKANQDNALERRLKSGHPAYTRLQELMASQPGSTSITRFQTRARLVEQMIDKLASSGKEATVKHFSDWLVRADSTTKSDLRRAAQAMELDLETNGTNLFGMENN